MGRLGPTCFDEGKMPVDEHGKAKELWLCFCQSLHMRIFHITWFTFFTCFFGWFATANLWIYISADIGLTDVDRGVAGSASVASTVAFRVIVGFLCDRIGPRYCYAFILIAAALPISLMSVVHDAVGYSVTSFFIGMAGGGFVVTAYHTTTFFTSSIVGTVNATAAGWGNFGGGVANAMMPLFYTAILSTNPGVTPNQAWRYTMLIPGFVMVFICAPLYFFFTVDTPMGNFQQLKKDSKNTKADVGSLSQVGAGTGTGASNADGAAAGRTGNQFQDQDELGDLPAVQNKKRDSFINRSVEEIKIAMTPIDKDVQGVNKPAPASETRSPITIAFSNYRTWVLVLQYAACFGIELTVLRFTAGYFIYDFGVSPTGAGFVVALFSLMNLFARSTGGFIADYMSKKSGGIQGRVYALVVCVFTEGVFLLLFSLSTVIGSFPYALVVMTLFGVFVQASEGVTYAIVPFVEPTAIGTVAGVVGAGGNLGAMIFALTIYVRVPDSIRYDTAYVILGIFVCIASLFVFLIRFPRDDDESVANTIVAK